MNDGVRKALAVGVVVLITIFMLTACVSTGNHGTILPPTRYDKPHSDVIALRFPPEKVAELCGDAHSLACARVGAPDIPCYMILPDTAPRGGAIERHERGHCNGWPASHPR